MKSRVLVVSILGFIIVATGIFVLLWWLVDARHPYHTIRLEGEGLGDVNFTAAYTRIRNAGRLFWWFYPTTSPRNTSRPIILWLDGVTGLPPSLFANFMMFGPYDVNLNRRSNSWIDEYNLLFVDAPVGVGFSKARNGRVPIDLDTNAQHLDLMLQSFYDLHSEYVNTTIYIFGQGDGAQLAVALSKRKPANVKGVIIGNGIISPAVTLTRLGFYLEELAYIDGNGRSAIEQLSNNVSSLVKERKYEEAFDEFVRLGDFVNGQAGAVAVNLRHIIDRLTRNSTLDYFGYTSYLEHSFSSLSEAFVFMKKVVAPAIGLPSDVSYDEDRNNAVRAFRRFFMNPSTSNVEEILQESLIDVTIYNGNLDAVSNTPGQLEWVNNLKWTGQQGFLNAPRNTLIVNSLVEGYFRETPRLTFYWMNAAGQAVPLESPVAMRRILDRITSKS